MVISHEQYNLYGNLPRTIAGSVPASPASPATISLDVSGSETVDLPADEYDYQLTATLTDGDRVTIAIGHLSVEAAPGTVPSLQPAV